MALAIRPAWIALVALVVVLPDAHLADGKAVAVGQQAVKIGLGVAEVGAYAAQAAEVVVVLGAGVGIEPGIQVLSGVLALDEGQETIPPRASSMQVLSTTA